MFSKSKFISLVNGQSLVQLLPSPSSFEPRHPFSSEVGQFYDYYPEMLRCQWCSTDDWLESLNRLPRKYFVYGDLKSPQYHGSITAVIGWASAGFYPSY